MSAQPGVGAASDGRRASAPPIGLLGGRQNMLLDAPVEAAGMDVGLVRPVLGVTSAAVVVAMFFAATHLREGEAALSAELARHLGIASARQVGPVVLFVVAGRPTGYEVSLGCTVAFLFVPFFGVTSLLLTLRRVPVTRSVASLAAALTLITIFNQLRLVIIATGMRVWGPEDGYHAVHLLPGTLISTLGVVLAGFAYLSILLRGTFTRAGADHG